MKDYKLKQRNLRASHTLKKITSSCGLKGNLKPLFFVLVSVEGTPSGDLRFEEDSTTYEVQKEPKDTDTDGYWVLGELLIDNRSVCHY